MSLGWWKSVQAVLLCIGGGLLSLLLIQRLRHSKRTNLPVTVYHVALLTLALTTARLLCQLLGVVTLTYTLSNIADGCWYLMLLSLCSGCLGGPLFHTPERHVPLGALSPASPKPAVFLLPLTYTVLATAADVTLQRSVGSAPFERFTYRGGVLAVPLWQEAVIYTTGGAALSCLTALYVLMLEQVAAEIVALVPTRRALIAAVPDAGVSLSALRVDVPEEVSSPVVPGSRSPLPMRRSRMSEQSEANPSTLLPRGMARSHSSPGQVTMAPTPPLPVGRKLRLLITLRKGVLISGCFLVLLMLVEGTPLRVMLTLQDAASITVLVGFVHVFRPWAEGSALALTDEDDSNVTELGVVDADSQSDAVHRSFDEEHSTPY